MKKSVLCLLFLVVVACAPTTKEGAAPPSDFRFGTEGLYMEFLPNLPPARLFGNEPITVMLQLENKGTADISPSDLRIYLSGYEQKIITGISDQGQVLKEKLSGRSAYLPKGDVATVDFSGRIAQLSIDKYQPTLLATACYYYQTAATIQVCIDPDPYAPTSIQKVCTPGTVAPGSQGAPLAVTSVEVEPSPDKTRFRIYVQNVGGGDLFKLGKLHDCSPYVSGLGYQDLDVIEVSDVQVGGTEQSNSIKPSCRPLDNGNLRISGGTASLFCEAGRPIIQGKTPYVTSLNIKLRYGYRQSIARGVEIRPSYAVT